MAITYDITQTGGTIASISQVRLELGDTVDGSGVKPDGTNFTDVEITYFYATEGNSVRGAAARAAEALARAWARMADTKAGPLQKNYSQVSKQWSSFAAELRDQIGGGYAVFGGKLARGDGYAYQAGSVDVAP
jgi:hypothetical protein